MKSPVHISKRFAVVLVTAAAITVATGILESGCSRGQAANGNAPQEAGAKSNTSPSEAALDLSPSLRNSFKVEPVGSYQFPVEKEAVGNGSHAGGTLLPILCQKKRRVGKCRFWRQTSGSLTLSRSSPEHLGEL
jgi:hypothetical protein